MGVMGYRPWEYYRLTPSELDILLTGQEYAIQLEWEQTRMICWYAANGDKIKLIKDRKKIISLPLIDKGMADDNDRFQKRIQELKRMKGLA